MQKNQEWLAIERSADVTTIESLKKDFRRIGITSGMTLLVHSSLSRIGWVNGGPVAVVQALMDTLTEEGTLVMPAHSGEYSDPARWQNPPVPESWWQTIRETMPAFHPDYSPTSGMGKIADTFRSFPGVLRSHHPALSFSAWGRHARFVTENHGLDYGLGEQSPLARIYELDGSVLLLGVGHDSNTSLHLAENRAERRVEIMKGAPVFENGLRVWKTYREIEFRTELFETIGERFEASNGIAAARVGIADCRLFRQRDAVDFAVEWLNEQEGAAE